MICIAWITPRSLGFGSSPLQLVPGASGDQFELPTELVFYVMMCDDDIAHESPGKMGGPPGCGCCSFCSLFGCTKSGVVGGFI